MSDITRFDDVDQLLASARIPSCPAQLMAKALSLVWCVWYNGVDWDTETGVTAVTGPYEI
jgi:hypothetical protein